jgi:hypothetical protein
MIRYLGFEATPQGRQYSFQVDGEPGRRVFRFVIAHDAFSAREVRFQDAPDLCFSLLQRALELEPALAAPAAPRVLLATDLADYRERQTKVPQKRRRAQPAPAA